MVEMNKRRELLTQIICTNEQSRALVHNTLVSVCELLSALQNAPATGTINRVPLQPPRTQLLKDPTGPPPRISPPLPQQMQMPLQQQKNVVAIKPAPKLTKLPVPQLIPMQPPVADKKIVPGRTTQRKKQEPSTLPPPPSIPVKNQLKRPPPLPQGSGSLLPKMLPPNTNTLTTTVQPRVVDLSEDQDMAIHTPPKAKLEKHSDDSLKNTPQSDFLSSDFEVSMFSPNSLQMIFNEGSQSTGSERKRKDRPRSPLSQESNSSPEKDAKRRKINFNNHSESALSHESPEMETNVNGKNALHPSPESALWDLSLSSVLGTASHTGGTPPQNNGSSSPATNTGRGFLNSPMSESLDKISSNSVQKNLAATFEREAQAEARNNISNTNSTDNSSMTELPKPKPRRKRKAMMEAPTTVPTMPTASMQDVESFLAVLHNK